MNIATLNNLYPDTIYLCVCVCVGGGVYPSYGYFHGSHEFLLLSVFGEET